MSTARPPHDTAAIPIDHYENFPVASWLCPRNLRAPIAAIYHFARTADDIADEGSASAAERLADLQAYRADLRAIEQAPGASGRWPQVFGPLAQALHRFRLPVQLLHDLLDAFEQDVLWTVHQRRYQDDAELLDYCRRSANPVGRLLLHLYAIDDPVALAHSDRICSALQLINFWQDVGADAARGRWYLSQAAITAYAVTYTDLRAGIDHPNAARMIAALCLDARRMMQGGAPLAFRIPGRAGWELRLVIQGGLRILDKIEFIGYATWSRRPRLRWWDWPVMLWRAWRMPGVPRPR